MNPLRMFAAVAALGFAAQAQAADVTLSFTGNIIVPTCTVDSTTANQTIPLTTASSSNFASVGSTQLPAAFNLKLKSCTSGAGVSMTVSGTSDTVTSVLKNTGTATGVGVQLLLGSSVGATTGTAIALNALQSVGTVDATNAMTIPMVAQYYRLGTMTAGTVAAAATVNFTYK
ncbi:fimbrial protein [Paraburkholderia tropica]|nr:MULTISPECIES: fimbrial protein [Paraburkholderia]RQM48136.1 type 1 fimbrial protein [Paraburkholderia bannensis]RQN36008.1 type 1 fimbrial protein [Paraburkholderia tropica]